jgi:hypothetical protein
LSRQFARDARLQRRPFFSLPQRMNDEAGNGNEDARVGYVEGRPARPTQLLQVVNLDQTNPDAAIGAGEDGSELSWRERGENTRLLRVAQAKPVRS